MRRDESIAKTLTVAAGVALLCSLMVSSAVYLLLPRQLAYGAVEHNRAIVEATGLVAADVVPADGEIVSKFLELERRIVDLERGEFTTEIDGASYDPRAALNDPALSVAIASADDIAGLGRRPRYLPVFLLIERGRIERLTVPIRAQGMWSTIYGYLGLASDLNTVVGVSFYEHGETPGIGGRIAEPAWQAKWQGKRLYDSTGQVTFRIGADKAGDGSSQVDAITGATATVKGVESGVRYWLGPDGFGPLLARLRGERIDSREQ